MMSGKLTAIKVFDRSDFSPLIFMRTEVRTIKPDKGYFTGQHNMTP